MLAVHTRLAIMALVSTGRVWHYPFVDGDGSSSRARTERGQTVMDINYASKDGLRQWTGVFEALPENSQKGIVNRGFNHYFGNECAAKVTGYTDKNPGATEDAIEAFKMEVFNDAVKKLIEGSIGVRATRVDPVEKVMADLALADLITVDFPENGIKIAKKWDTDTTVLFADQSTTIGEMLELKLEAEADFWREQAGLELARREREKAEKAALAEARKAAKPKGGLAALLAK